MTKEKAIEIFNNYQSVELARSIDNPLTFTKFRNCNVYIADDTMEVLGHTIRLIKSYNTIVGYVDLTEDVFVEIGKFSRTTSKQCTQIYNTYYRNCERLNAMQYVCY